MFPAGRIASCEANYAGKLALVGTCSFPFHVSAEPSWRVGVTFCVRATLIRTNQMLHRSLDPRADHLVIPTYRAWWNSRSASLGVREIVPQPQPAGHHERVCTF